MIEMNIPAGVVKSIARAKSLFKRDETIRALDAFIEGLTAYEPEKLMRKARFEAEVLIEECISELNRQPEVRMFFEKMAKTPDARLLYTPGQEGQLHALLTILRKGLNESIIASQNSVETERQNRRAMLWEKGVELLKKGDHPRGRATLRVLADEFGKEENVFLNIANALLDAQLSFEAADFFEQAIDLFPKERKAYAGATATFISLQEYEKAEEVYIKAIKQFGNHTITLTNLAKLYAVWNKKEKAREAAQSAYTLDPSNTEAKEIIDQFS